MILLTGVLKFVWFRITSAKIALTCQGLQSFFHCILILNHRRRSRLVNFEYESVYRRDDGKHWI